MTDRARKAEQFRALHIPGEPLVLFNVWDAGGAKAVATAGAKAIATGSWSVAHAHGFADGERMPLALAIDNLGRIVGATDLPVTINLETDVLFQRPPEQHDDAMVVEAITRARAYAEAGADGLFAPGLVDITLIARLAEASPLPLNIMVGDATPPLRAFSQHGVARVSHGPRAYLMAMKALGEAARAAAGDANIG